ncbi:hypothetical protein [Streptomyces uncialis]|uniref:hypothetical protein n=1 Tax=Streptomyces uncialis TaxID=1048205 RepID=UPI00386988C8|nr:hypothetical protein OG924_04150 [Streptomyces uncialis]
MTDNSSPRSRDGRRRRTPALIASTALGSAAVLAVSIGAGGPVLAADTPGTGTGSGGQKLSASVTKDLNPAGQAIRITGKDYDETKGVYVAVCKDNGPGRAPSPCVGGVDMTGGSKSSAWIVPKGDSHAGELATAFGPGGTFDVELQIEAKSTTVDCAEVACSVVTRVDHRGLGDRSQDVRIPVTFAAGPPPGGEGVGVPPGTVSYHRTAEFTTAGKPLDVLLHPESKKLYVGSDNLADTADIDERGLYVLNPEDGKALAHLNQAPGNLGTPRASSVSRFIGPLAGDGARFQYPLRGIGSAKQGDTAMRGVWLATGGTVHDVGPGTSTPTAVLVAQGSKLSEIDPKDGATLRSLTLESGSRFAVDTARGSVWFADFPGGKLYRVDTATLTLKDTIDVPDIASDATGVIEVDPESGAVWLGTGGTILVLGPDGKPVKKITDSDQAIAVAFDKSSRQAFVVRQDRGDLNEPGNDNNGSLTTYDTTDHTRTTEPVSLPGNHGQVGAAAVTVEAGGAVVYVTHPAEGKVLKLVRRVSPKVTEAPADVSVEPGENVTFTARAEGTPEPARRWQISTDGTTWKDVEGATSATLAFTAELAQNGHKYRAEFKNDAGTTRTYPVTLTVEEEQDTTAGTTTGTDGGSTDGGTDGGSTEGGTTDGGTDGGSTDGGSTDGGSDSGGADGGGSAGGSAGGWDSGGTGGSTGGSGSGGSVGGGSAGGSTGSGGVETTGGGGGVLASTGATVLSAAAAAAALTAAGAVLVRRRRTATANGPDSGTSGPASV